MSARVPGDPKAERSAVLERTPLARSLHDARVMAVMSRWLDWPRALLAEGPAEPYLVVEERLTELRRLSMAADATWTTVDVANASDVGAVIDTLKLVLPFPDWCGSSWDSIADAFEEIRQSWSFPLIIAVGGLNSMLESRPHLALETVLRLSELGQAVSSTGDQLTVFYVADKWV